MVGYSSNVIFTFVGTKMAREGTKYARFSNPKQFGMSALIGNIREVTKLPKHYIDRMRVKFAKGSLFIFIESRSFHTSLYDDVKFLSKILRINLKIDKEPMSMVMFNVIKTKKIIQKIHRKLNKYGAIRLKVGTYLIPRECIDDFEHSFDDIRIEIIRRFNVNLFEKVKRISKKKPIGSCIILNLFQVYHPINKSKFNELMANGMFDHLASSYIYLINRYEKLRSIIDQWDDNNIEWMKKTLDNLGKGYYAPESIIALNNKWLLLYYLPKIEIFGLINNIFTSKQTLVQYDRSKKEFNKCGIVVRMSIADLVNRMIEMSITNIYTYKLLKSYLSYLINGKQNIKLITAEEIKYRVISKIIPTGEALNKSFKIFRIANFIKKINDRYSNNEIKIGIFKINDEDMKKIKKMKDIVEKEPIKLITSNMFII